MSQTFLHAACLQALYTPVPQDGTIQSVFGITEARAIFITVLQHEELSDVSY